MTHVLVLGAGFGGLAAAHELRSRLPSDATVTVVSATDQFFMGFAKLWELSGLRPLSEGTRPLTNLGAHGIDVVHATITGIDAAAHTVTTTSGELSGDGMIVALGAGPAPGHRSMLDAHDFAHDLYDHESMLPIRDAVDGLGSGHIVLSILGGPFKCPPAPYEAALIVDQRLRERGVRGEVSVTMTTPQPISLPAAGKDASTYVAAHLADAGIELRTTTKVTGLTHGSVTLDDGSELSADLFLGVPATAPPPVIADSGLADDTGWIRPDRATFATAVERVYAVGDCTTVPNAAGALPKAGVFAAGEGVVAAANLAAALGHGDGAAFDGHGYCFLELPGERVAFVEGNFYADPVDVTLTDADHEQFRRKLAYESERLDAWLGTP